MKLLIARMLVGAGGLVLIGIGAHGILAHPGDTHPQRWAKWLVGGALVHDLAFAPLLALVGAALARFVPASIRAVVQAGLIVSGAVLAVGLVGVFGLGKRNYPDNGSLLPLPYARNLLVVLAAVWMVTIAAATVTAYRHRRRRATVPDPVVGTGAAGREE